MDRMCSIQKVVEDSDRFDSSNLILNGNANLSECAKDLETASNDYPYWQYTEPIIATVIDYNAFASFNETLSSDCGFWGGKVNDPSGDFY
ncbi:unnamed protein product [Didymodactylos carnosus]|uniref:Uncharacterized protein n=1 Tax=Didymodactylos carnosus TaxID=1234261 RepID=A0A815JFL8_9BILA|nr:unnamed protein product [Didymodactylos carnosus]CAF4271609.1 unnamed protein product [Didymodactylos carnosus]